MTLLSADTVLSAAAGKSRRVCGPLSLLNCAAPFNLSSIPGYKISLKRTSGLISVGGLSSSNDVRFCQRRFVTGSSYTLQRREGTAGRGP